MKLPARFLRQAALLFLCVSVFNVPLFGEEEEMDELTLALKEAIPKYTSDGMDVEEISRLLDAGADPNGLYDTWMAQTFLIHAAYTNNVPLARLLLDHGADPNAIRLDGRWPIRPEKRSAVFDGNEKITALFISYGARFDVTSENGYSPLRSQAYSRKASAILILEWEETHSPDFSANFENRKDYLTDVLACILDDSFLDHYAEEVYTLTERLLDAGADPAAMHKDGFPIAYLPVKELRYSHFIIPLLIERGAPVDAFNEDGKTALYCAIAAANLDLASFLLKRGADPNQKCKSGETALIKAYSKEEISLLLSFGADPNLQDGNGRTALMNDRKPECINLLFQAGANPAIKDNKGRTVLHHWGYDLIGPMYDDLIERGCRIDEPDHEGYTPLIYAADRSSRRKILLLLEKGADPNYRGPKGRTALHVYLLEFEKDHWRRDDVPEERDRAVIAALLEAGTRPADRDDEGDSALATAIRIARKNANMDPVRDMVQKYANDAEIKIAAAEAGKKVSAEKRQNAKKAVSENSLPTLKALSFPVILGGLSIVTREIVYKDAPHENIMGPVNAVLTLGGSGMFLGMMIGARQHHGSEWSDMFGPVVSGLAGGFIGGITGIVIACLPPVYKAFNDVPVLYYAPAVVSAIIASVVIFGIWF